MSDPDESVAAHPRVLVLDDDELLCRFLEKILQRRGYEVVSETSAVDALELLRTEAFDLVISDLNMDELDGLTFAKRVRGLDRDLPVILITGSAVLETGINAVLAGAWAFIAKPVDPKELAISLERAYRHRLLTREARALRLLVGAS